MTTHPTLRPCPFCGSIPILLLEQSNDTGARAGIFCRDARCPAQPGMTAPGESAVVKAWNTALAVSTSPIPVAVDKSLEILNQLLHEGRLILNGAGAYSAPISPEFTLDTVSENLWEGSGLLFHPKSNWKTIANRPPQPAPEAPPPPDWEEIAKAALNGPGFGTPGQFIEKEDKAPIAPIQFHPPTENQTNAIPIGREPACPGRNLEYACILYTAEDRIGQLAGLHGARGWTLAFVLPTGNGSWHLIFSRPIV